MGFSGVGCRANLELCDSESHRGDKGSIGDMGRGGSCDNDSDSDDSLSTFRYAAPKGTMRTLGDGGSEIVCCTMDGEGRGDAYGSAGTGLPLPCRREA